MVQSWSAPAPPREQGYSVACPEGHRLHGMRTEGYQALRCPTCGEGIFVLPRSPLPEPAAPASAARRPAEAMVEAYPDDGPMALSDPSPLTTSTVDPHVEDAPEVEIDWVDEGPAASPDPPRAPGPESPFREAARPRPGPAPAPKPKPRKPRSPAAPAPSPPPPAVVVPRPRLSERAWRHRNALLAAGLILLVAGAVAFRSRRQRLEDLPRIAEIGRTEGLRKLDEGEFHAAKKILGDAAAAVEGMGGRFEGAESIRQAALEAAIFTDLVPGTLGQLLEEAATFRDGNSWPSHFAGMYQGRSVILDVPISAVPDPARAGSAYQVEAPIYFGRGLRPEGQGRIDLAGFELFENARPRLGDQQTFGARLRSLELDPATNQWVMTFEPDSGVYITHAKALEAIGWPAVEPAEEAQP